MPLIETEEAARRLARAIASDLSLYNEDKILAGIQNDNLFDSLAEEIEEGRALFQRRVSPELFPRNLYDRALVVDHASAGLRLDRFVASKIGGASRSEVQRWIEGGRVRVSGGARKAAE